MGKQNNTDDKLNKVGLVLIVIMAVAFLLFAFAILLAPIVVLILFLVNWIRYLVQDRKRRCVNFWLSVQEQKEYKQSVYIISNAQDEIRKVQDSVNIHGISRNQDGQISQRSYLGKELRERENSAKFLIDKYTSIYEELQSRPYTRWRKARSHYSNAFGFGFIIFIILAMFGFLQLSNVLESKPLNSTLQSEVVEQPKEDEQNDQTEQIGTSIDKSNEISGLELYGVSMGIMAGILAVLAIIWLIGWLIGRIRFGLKNPKPPFVSMDNVDVYIEKYIEKRARKEAKHQHQKETLKQKYEQKRIEKKLAKEEKNYIAGQKSKECNQKIEAKNTSDVSIEETVATVHIENNTHKRSKEEELFISCADSLRNEGFSIIGNWEDWENSGLWKNLAVVSSISGVNIRIVVEYYVKSKRFYFGIAKLNDEDKVSQELLNSGIFQNIITENELIVKNNEWWYCLKFSTLDKVFQEYRHLIEVINRG